jgi:hypothetical protein
MNTEIHEVSMWNDFNDIVTQISPFIYKCYNKICFVSFLSHWDTLPSEYTLSQA